MENAEENKETYYKIVVFFLRQRQGFFKFNYRYRGVYDNCEEKERSFYTYSLVMVCIVKMMIRVSEMNHSLECIHGGKTIVRGDIIVLAQSNVMW
jgi:hypothetical protein